MTVREKYRTYNANPATGAHPRAISVMTEPVPVNSAIEDIVTVAETYAQLRNLSLSRVSTLCFNDGSKLPLLAEGKVDIGVKRLERALQWFSDNWPEAGRWPVTVQRPEPAAETMLINTGTPQVWGQG